MPASRLAIFMCFHLNSSMLDRYKTNMSILNILVFYCIVIAYGISIGGDRVANQIESRSISGAKQAFTKLIREALKGHEVIVENAKNHDAEAVSILATEDFMYVLDSGYKFHVEVTDDEDGVAIIVKEIGIFGYGLSFREAKEDLLLNIEEYVKDYFGRSEFFKSIPQRRAHYPYLRRLAACNSTNEMSEVVFECCNSHSMTS